MTSLAKDPWSKTTRKNEEAAAEEGAAKGAKGEPAKEGSKKDQQIIQNIPTTFKEMFQFNAAVMDSGTSLWINEALVVFDNIVSNV